MSKLRDALTSSLSQETDSFRSRLERAEATFQTPVTKPQNKNGAVASKPKKKEQEEKREAVIRDSFTMPQDDYTLIAQVRERALSVGVSVTKAEILRAALKTFSNLKDAELIDTLASLDKVKTGRPSVKEVKS